MTQPDPDKLRLAWVERTYSDLHDEPDEPDWRDEWVDRPDHYDR